MGVTEPRVRLSAVAGTFYPGDAAELDAMVKGFLADAKAVKLPGKLRGLVVPHAGYVYSGPIAAYGYKALSKCRFSTAVVLGPSHYAMFPGACESGYDLWETPLGRVKAKSAAGGIISVFPPAHVPEHCIEVQLPFLQHLFGERVGIWPLLCGEVEPSALAEKVAGKVDDDAVVIASSDLSHYLSYEEARKIDRVANESVPSLDIRRFERDGDACGKTAILTLMHIAKRKGWKGVFLDYRNSGDTAGPKSGVVGYGCYAFCSE